MNKYASFRLIQEIAIWLLSVVLVIGGAISAQHRFMHVEHATNGLTQICINSYSSSQDSASKFKHSNSNSTDTQNKCDACITSNNFYINPTNTVVYSQSVNLSDHNSRKTAWHLALKAADLPPARGPPSFIF